jgi:alpha-galactosidase
MRPRLLASAALLLAGLIAAPSPIAAAAPPLSPTPPMGFNNWARYECGVTEAIMVRNADALVSTGLAAKGYNTVTVDDCWMTRNRDTAGNLVTDTNRFPRGMRWLADYVHGKGLKFGIYEDAGTLTCGGFAGSWNHFQADANLFASFGVDYLKLDGCNVPGVSGQTREQTYRGAYSQMAQALANTGRNIVFSESAPAYFQGSSDWYTVLGWVAQFGQLWREGFDIAVHENTDKFSSVLGNYGYNVPLSRYAGPNHWNDPDFLIAGDGLTDDEARSQLALWAMMSAPLILSTDVAALSSASVSIVGNADVIAVDQDPLGVQGSLVAANGTVDTLAKPLSGGARAVAMLNRGNSTTTATTSTAAIGYLGGAGCGFGLKNLWTGATSSTTGTISASIPPHGTVIFRITPSSGCTASQPTGQITGPGGKCVDDSGSGTVDGTQQILFGCTGNPNQRWTLPGDGTVRTLGKCLTANGTGDGALVQLFSCNGSTAQRWQYRLNGNLVNAASSKCLDAIGGGSADLTKLGVWPCGNNQANQIWALPV